ncbi:MULTISPECIES: hypothetical protein [Streptomyces]|uniref:Uncharacterized protein n=1 Tax=Streptomyces eurythermus TaxID=42237 RepID=A0ABW6Z914_9ACTN|nr:hypothetical protein [Streptomyces sp. DSM 40868]
MHPQRLPQGFAELVEGAVVDVGEGQTEQDVAAVDVPVPARGVLQWFAAQEFVQRQVGTAVVVEAGGEARRPEVRAINWRTVASPLGVSLFTGGRKSRIGGVEVEQPGAQSLAGQGPGGHDLGQRGDVVHSVPARGGVAALGSDCAGAEEPGLPSVVP